jgi:DNA-binding beta-propeller fold protein YncE/thiol-disulfide isomerase/thioredoxin
MDLQHHTLQRPAAKAILVLILVATLSGQGAFGQNIQTLPNRVRAPALDGGSDWINTSGPLDLGQLRGKFVLLDFWTYCCINCMHILPELKKLEQKYANELVVIGVHSGKFFSEGDSKNIHDAVLRYGIEHPVVNDAQRILWTKYQVSVWPSFRIIDPEGFVIATHSGETTFEALDAFFSRAVLSYRRKRVLDETPLRFELERYSEAPTPLRFPGKIYADEASDRLFISDSSHNRIVVTRLDGTLVDVIGSGGMGRQDGGYRAATFDHPQAAVLHQGHLYVADTENHSIRKIDLVNKQVTTIAGTGKMSSEFVVRSAGRPTSTSLSSPWALCFHEGELYIAMAGKHQIWKMTFDPPKIFPYAGNCEEDIIDGPLLPRTAYQKGFAAFAQPSGLTSDGQWLFVADSEGSSIRAVPFLPNDRVRTVIGTAALPDNRLFTFGDREGRLAPGMLQHPLGVAYDNKRIYVADTYNNKIKVIDLATSTLKTIAGDFESGRTDQPARFDEPAGLSIAANKLFVADTNNHLVRVIDLADNYAVKTLDIKGLEPPDIEDSTPIVPLANLKQTTFAATEVKPVDGQLELSIELNLPEGNKLNSAAPMSYRVEVLDGDKIISADAVGKSQQISDLSTRFNLDIPLAATQGAARLNIMLTFFYCREGSEAVCKVGDVSWTGLVTLSDKARTEQLELKHVAW